MNEFGKNLIFLISQPRSGSTMLQLMLRCHKEIKTFSEPWLMLQPLSLIGKNDFWRGGDFGLSKLGVTEFLKDIPYGEDEYIVGVRKMFSHLYGCALEGQKKYFLDKTPRYYQILPELRRAFPEAKFILLLRNPIDVLLSILNSWINEEIFELFHYRFDLLDAPRLLIGEIERKNNKISIVNYEKLINSPELVMKRLCKDLEIEYDKNMVNYGKLGNPEWRLGDKNAVKFCRPAKKIIYVKERLLKQKQYWRLSHNYLCYLGKDIFDKLGYSYQNELNIIDNFRPPNSHILETFSLIYLLEKPKNERNKCVVDSWWSKNRFRRLIHRTTIQVARKAFGF